MDTKRIPAIIALIAAGVTCVVSIFQQVSFGTFTLRFLCSTIVFLFIGSVIKIVVDCSFKVIEEENPEAEDSEEGETDENLENIDSQENKTDDQEFSSEGSNADEEDF